MAEWWTYRLSDLLLFSPPTYYRLFELYNRDIWPLQLLALALGAAMVVLVLRKPVWQGRALAAMLAAAWLWVAWAYHLERYATINWAAPWFAMLFGLQALLLIWRGVIRDQLAFEIRSKMLDRIGLGVFFIGLVVYPLLAPLLGREWTQAEVFGIAPDPTAVATLGVLLLVPHRMFWSLLALPVAWCMASGAILWTMGSPEALLAPAAALVVIGSAVVKRVGLK